MQKAFRPMPLEDLARWIFRDLSSGETVLGIPRQNLSIPGPRLGLSLVGRRLAAPLGVAAGPHTQLAQNIVAAWLCGARFIELKTVQLKDELEISRPCIDAADETYNVEWSQELRLEESYAEYLHAWVLLHALAHALGLPAPGTLFNMSVGYDLAGIQHPRVQRFIAGMRDASAEIPGAVAAVARAYPAVREVEIPAAVSDHITLSTMHGCPSGEIERIARYLLLDLGVHTWVKLNPTLLGAEPLRQLLNRDAGFDVEVPDAAFAHDPTFSEAMDMARSLAGAVAGRPQAFGLKLTNTLEVVNRRPIFPAREHTMYLSGRALHPLSLHLAKRVREALGLEIPLSFAGGADATNFPQLVAAGLTPVTVCTDLLRPGGYARLGQYLANLDSAVARAGADDLAAYLAACGGVTASLDRHAGEVVGAPRYGRRERPLAFKGARTLSAFDCVAAPCQEACPAQQNVADYLWLIARGRPSEALSVILRTNSLPGVTGSICDHPCTERCVRNYYDAPLAIRELKRFAVERGAAPLPRPAAPGGESVAIVGAGPAGLSAAYHLLQRGLAPVIYEAAARAGGMVAGVIPGYRLARSAIDGDLARLKELGVRIELGQAVGRDLSLEELRRRHRFVFLAVGAQSGKRLGAAGEEAKGVIDALTFLRRVQAGHDPALGSRALVIGGGNTAMDAARTARRVMGALGQVTIVYRRRRADMPAEPGEVRDCELEGVRLRTLLAPSRIVSREGRVVGLACTPMKLGERDASGRPRPVPSGEPEVVLGAETVIVAVGQELSATFLDAAGVGRTPAGSVLVDPATGETSLPGLFAGGDAVRGASSVVHAIADGRAAAEAIASRCGLPPTREPHLEKSTRPAELLSRKAAQAPPRTVPVLPLSDRGGFAEVVRGFDPEAALAEASRCLDCDELCSLCVTVCPNRALVAYSAAPCSLDLPDLVVRGGRLVPGGRRTLSIEQPVQILKLGGFCNECGNCETFCPTAGAPHRHKPTFWQDDEGFREARGEAYRLERRDGRVVLSARIGGRSHRLERRGAAAEYRSEEVVASLSAEPWALLEARPAVPLAEGHRVELATCAALIALLATEPALPPAAALGGDP
ncbi:MAG TPA: FAD-dependent oxidoreductase [Anaeromyxobacter sp.]|nr:FAD-dependent oxidoreductase [Anaeromyxobacter sp.]